jgi:small subunit ribosomal protein S24e
MRPALRLVRYRHRPMQQSLDTPIKRSLSQQATALVQPPPAKRQRPDSFSSVPPSNTMAFRGRGPAKRPAGPPDGPSSKQFSKRANRPSAPPKNVLSGPFHDQEFITKHYLKSAVDLKVNDKHTPKSPLHNFYAVVKDGQQPKYDFARGSVIREDQYVDVWRYVRSCLTYTASNCSFRTTVFLDIDPPIFGVGDHTDKKESINLAALAALYQLHELNLVCYICIPIIHSNKIDTPA